MLHCFKKLIFILFTSNFLITCYDLPITAVFCCGWNLFYLAFRSCASITKIKYIPVCACIKKKKKIENTGSPTIRKFYFLQQLSEKEISNYVVSQD